VCFLLVVTSLVVITSAIDSSLKCIEWDVKRYSPTQSLTYLLSVTIVCKIYILLEVPALSVAVTPSI